MTKKNRPNFSSEFRLETAQLVVDQRGGSQGSSMTPEQVEVRELKKRVELRWLLRPVPMLGCEKYDVNYVR